MDMWSTVTIRAVELPIDDVPQNEREGRCNCEIAEEQQPYIPVASQDSQTDEQDAECQQDASGLNMVQADA